MSPNCPFFLIQETVQLGRNNTLLSDETAKLGQKVCGYLSVWCLCERKFDCRLTRLSERTSERASEQE